jgi:hypothetical protein
VIETSHAEMAAAAYVANQTGWLRIEAIESIKLVLGDIARAAFVAGWNAAQENQVEPRAKTR